MMIPDRKEAKDYCYHIYDYDESRKFTRSPNLGVKQQPYFSLEKDMAGIHEVCQQKGLFSKFASIGKSAEGKEIYCLEFGSSQDSAPQILFTGGIHGREWLAVEVPYLIAEYLVKNYPEAVPQSSEQLAIKSLLDNGRILVIPMLNPDGHTCSVLQKLNWRKNRRPINDNEFDGDGYSRDAATIGYEMVKFPPVMDASGAVRKLSPQRFPIDNQYVGVDLNRNFATDKSHAIGLAAELRFATEAKQGRPWVDYTQDNFTDPDYFGPRIASEPETKVISSFISSRDSRIKAAIDYHSFGRAILYPYEFVIERAARDVGELLRSLIIDKDGVNGYELGNSKEVLGYIALCTFKDYVRQVTNCPLVYGIELDPVLRADDRLFQPDESEILPVFQKNIRAALALIQCAESPRQRLRAVVVAANRQFSDWAVFERGNLLPEIDLSDLIGARR